MYCTVHYSTVLVRLYLYNTAWWSLEHVAGPLVAGREIIFLVIAQPHSFFVLIVLVLVQEVMREVGPPHSK